MAYLAVENIKKSYGKNVILDGISFSLEKGQALAIAGCNGCGKSTLLNILAGAIRGQDGKILLEGKTLTKKEISQYIGYVPQNSPFIDEMSVKDNIRFWYAGDKKRIEQDFKDGILAKFGLEKYLNYKVQSLSGGMKKRLSIACALVNNPPVMLLDEPGAALDLVCKKDIINYLNDYKANGGIVIISSHEEGELKMCDTILMIKDKKLVPVKFEEIENEIRNEEE